MAQVTMTGLEYIELMRKADQLEELINWFCKATQVRFPEDSIKSYTAGEFPEYVSLPKWLDEARINYMAGWLCDLPEDEFIRWIESGMRYLDLQEMSFARHNFGDHYVDLWEHPKLRKVVEMVQKNLNEDKEDEQDD
jgi:hypothetical protein